MTLTIHDWNGIDWSRRNETNPDNTCSNCGSHVTPEFTRAYGNGGDIEACFHCAPTPVVMGRRDTRDNDRSRRQRYIERWSEVHG